MVYGPDKTQPLPNPIPGQHIEKENAKPFITVPTPSDTPGVRLNKRTIRLAAARESKASKAALNTLDPQRHIHTENVAKTKLQELKSSFSRDTIIEYTPQTHVETGEQYHLENALITLISCQRAAEGFAYNSAKVKSALESFDLNKPSKEMAKEIKKAFFGEIKTKEFLIQCEIERGKLLPPSLEHTFEVDNKKYEEKREFIDNWASVAYLRIFDPKYKDQISFIEENSVRNGSLKSPEEAQGMLLNGQVHTLSADKKIIGQELRSGAFCVHSNLPEADCLNLSVAQALAKITKAIELLLNDPKKVEAALDAGEILYVEQSFLSTGDSHENKMCKQMDAAMDYLTNHATVQFSETEQGVKMDGEKLVVTIKKPKDLEIWPLRLRSILFVQGVNEKQSAAVGFFKPTAFAYQTEINQKGIKSLQEYAEKSERREDITALTSHFNNTDQPNKDIQGVRAIRDAVEALGGVRGISCKTGKDRTAAEVNDTLAAKAAPTAPNTPSNETKMQIRDKLAGGISFQITGQCTGKQNAYAFNRIQYEFLPPDWRPPKKYCGNVPS